MTSDVFTFDFFNAALIPSRFDWEETCTSFSPLIANTLQESFSRKGAGSNRKKYLNQPLPASCAKPLTNSSLFLSLNMPVVATTAVLLVVSRHLSTTGRMFSLASSGLLDLLMISTSEP